VAAAARGFEKKKRKLPMRIKDDRYRSSFAYPGRRTLARYRVNRARARARACAYERRIPPRHSFDNNNNDNINPRPSHQSRTFIQIDRFRSTFGRFSTSALARRETATEETRECDFSFLVWRFVTRSAFWTRILRKGRQRIFAADARVEIASRTTRIR